MFETGKIYTPIGFLPGLTRTGRTRPQASLRDDAVLIFLGLFTLLALFWDGILHNNEVGQDEFWSPPHMALYLGLASLGVWIALVLLRHQENRQVLDISLIPRGYGLAVIALPLAAIVRAGRHDLARRLRLREPDRLDVQPAASGPVHLRRDAGRRSRPPRRGSGPATRPRCGTSCPPCCRSPRPPA